MSLKNGWGLACVVKLATDARIDVERGTGWTADFPYMLRTSLSRHFLVGNASREKRVFDALRDGFRDISEFSVLLIAHIGAVHEEFEHLAVIVILVPQL